MNQWFWIIGLFGWSMKFLNNSSKILNYATKAVYPFYIFHQTVIVAAAFYVVKINAPLGVKLLIILVFTFFSILAIYEYILKRSPITQFMFGIKVKLTKRETMPSVTEQRSLETKLVLKNNSAPGMLNKGSLTGN